MMESNRVRVALMALAFAFTAAACNDTKQPLDLTGPSFAKSNDKANANSNKDKDKDKDDDSDEGDENMRYVQVEFLGNPLVSEVTILKANHDRYNRTQPYNTDEFRPQTAAFVNMFRSAESGVAATLGAVLYPDMLIVEPSRSTATSGWLSWALAGGWGGRNLSDDVVDAGLSAIFGTIVSADGALCANFTLPLCTDNVPNNNTNVTSTFPYLASPNM